MIFRKPYAFLIKHFKKINIVLTILAGYLAYRSFNIVAFFNTYINSNYTGNFYSGFANNYVSTFVYFITFLLILGIFALVALFVYKKKPNKAYISAFISYIVIFAFLIFIKNTMVTMESTPLTAETARIYRDLSIISVFPQIAFIFLFFIQVLGLHFGKFNFVEDLQNLENDEEDNEEVEITIKSDNVALKRNLRRFIREFKVYLKENKFIVFLIALGLIISIIFITYKSLPEIVDKHYSQGDVFVTNGINFEIENSIITNLDYKGDKISADKYYLVLKLTAQNTTGEDHSLDFKDFKLDVNDRYVYPTLDKNSKFIDYGKTSINNVLKKDQTNGYTLVYEISNNDIKKRYQIKVSNGYAISDNLKIGKYNYVTISPVILEKVTTVGEYKIGDEINLNSSNLNNSKFTLKSVDITDKYIYDYEQCTAHVCNNYKNKVNIDYLAGDKTLLVLSYEYSLDETSAFKSNFSNNVNTFAEKFMKIRYLNDSKLVDDTVKNVTPNNLKDKIILEVSKNAESTHELYLIITIRDKEYIIKIK